MSIHAQTRIYFSVFIIYVLALVNFRSGLWTCFLWIQTYLPKKWRLHKFHWVLTADLLLSFLGNCPLYTSDHIQVQCHSFKWASCPRGLFLTTKLHLGLNTSSLWGTQEELKTPSGHVNLQNYSQLAKKASGWGVGGWLFSFNKSNFWIVCWSAGGCF